MNSFNKIIFISLLVFVGCNSQSLNKNIEVMEQQECNEKKYHEPETKINMKFDTVQFKQANRYGKYSFIDTDGMEVTQRVSTEFPSGKVEKYIENRSFPNSPYRFYSEYDDKGNIIKYIKSFSAFHIGVGLYYDSVGNIVKEENFDAPYPFSVNDLINKMREEYGADLLNKNNGSASRYQEKEHLGIPLYMVNYFIIDTPFKNVYLINGNTGETMFISKRTIWETDDNEISVLDEYLNSLK